MEMAFLVYGKKCDYCHSYFSSLVLSKKCTYHHWYWSLVILVGKKCTYLQWYLSFLDLGTKCTYLHWYLSFLVFAKRCITIIDACRPYSLALPSSRPNLPSKKPGQEKKIASNVSPSLLLVISTRHNKNDSPCSGHNLPVQELKHRKGQSPHQPKSTKKVPVQDTASLFRSLNTDKDKAHTNPNQQRTSLFRTQPPFSGAQSSRKTVTHPPSLPPTASATKKTGPRSGHDLPIQMHRDQTATFTYTSL